MRPVRLQLEGFTAFRDAVDVNFAGADLFALVGATGAGKSSLIDALVFCLYGAVPRLDLRTVEPVIAAGRNEARVRFDFTVGETPYTAARVVRRLPRGGATTKEARLESREEVLASDARAVTDAVERVLGLRFDQFTKCVVLPQGEFARFLHDKPRDRQDLLVRLLELDVYERMREAASARHKAADQQAAWIERQIADLAYATPEALATVERRITELTTLREALDAAQPRLDALAAEQAAAAQTEAKAAGHAERLAHISEPAEAATLAEQMAEADRRTAEAEQAHAAAEEAVDAAETGLGALPARSDLEGLREAHAQHAALAERRAKGEPIVVQARAAAETAEANAARAEETVAEAEAALETAKRVHAAHALAAHLEPGAPCPVCAQVVAKPPARPAPPALGAAEAALARARQARVEATQAVRQASERRAKAEQTLTDVETSLAATRERLADRPGAEETARLLEDVDRAEAELAAARKRERAARRSWHEAAAHAKAVAEQQQRAWQVFDEARDAVAVLDPPPADRADLAAAWQAFAAWASSEAERQSASAADAGRTREQAERAHAALTRELAERCDAAGVAVGDARPRDACADALAAATAEHQRVAEALAKAAELRKEHEAQRETAAVTETLARHLSARGFERWLLDEALHALCTGATGVLRELSGGRYSLDIDEQHNFAVIDHRNADERRSARTLSGGETFLASLALALSLAEHLRELAVGATPRLESIFLDEGFGTLDPESLDVVATTVEELGASGRTVGLVTHVRELAERVPVRFEVRRGSAGSVVERVEA